MLWGDTREMWNGSTMPDSRVTHFWDGDRRAGQWFDKQVDGYDGIAWDVYYLYGPEAIWKTVPSPLAGSGGTIFYKQAALKEQVNTLLEK